MISGWITISCPRGILTTCIWIVNPPCYRQTNNAYSKGKKLGDVDKKYETLWIGDYYFS